MNYRTNIIIDGVTYHGKSLVFSNEGLSDEVDYYKSSLQYTSYFKLCLEDDSILIISGDKARQAIIIIEKLGE